MSSTGISVIEYTTPVRDCSPSSLHLLARRARSLGLDAVIEDDSARFGWR